MLDNLQNVLGTVKLDSGYAVRVWAPSAKAVYLRGDFNEWESPGLPLEADGDGCWSVICEQLQCNQGYQFYIQSDQDEMLVRNDPRARHMTNSAGHALVYDDNFDWQSNDFKIANWNTLVIYELHIGTYHSQINEHGESDQPGTFYTAIEKLDHLVDLGINCIELMPVNEFAGDYSWGYNPAYPFAVEEAYGGPDGLKAFVDAAHQRGIAVILDVVYNHFGPSDLHLWQFDGWSENDKGGIYFYNDWRSSTPWGDTRPDYGRPEVRQYIFDNAMMWLNEFRLDGLRMDMIPFMRSVSGSEESDDLIKEAYDLIRWVNHSVHEQHPHKLVIAEDLHNNDFVTQSCDEGGLGFGAQWDADFVHPVRDILIQPEDDSRDLHKLEYALKHSFSGRPFERVVYVESHDEVANGQARVAEEIAPGQVDEDYFARQRSVIGAALVLTAPGIPMLFQGQELLEDLWFDDARPLDWSRAEQFPQLLKAYQQLIRLRLNEQGLTKGLTLEGIEVVHFDLVNKVIAYCRQAEHAEQGNVIVLINLKNLSHDSYQADGFYGRKWQCIFNWSQGLQPTEALNVSAEEGFNQSLEAYQVLIYSDKV
ncbi:alpha-amylase family glycosyl hydrolase [Gayadomonas joobiniege]|uniref:alpha-amylase family glycosyl hydrolase n=1 Tax=Gayadomonas joobiniege TaxID=1234606 RepID=UPI000375C363|nr:alpha-amylase family glycosyl hydrolase [Gayadomonas joobiniege]